MSGFVRADQIVRIRAMVDRLEVTLPVSETDPRPDFEGAIRPMRCVVGKLSVDDDDLSARALADFISKCHGEGKRGVIKMGEDGVLDLWEFDPLEVG